VTICFLIETLTQPVSTIGDIYALLELVLRPLLLLLVSDLEHAALCAVAPLQSTVVTTFTKDGDTLYCKNPQFCRFLHAEQYYW